MKRRANGEGTVKQRRDGRWEAQVVLEDGRRRSLYAPTQREVLERLRLERGHVAMGLPTPNGRLTVGAYLARWHAGRRSKLRPRVWTRYEQLIRLDAAGIARIPLAKLAPHHLEELYEDRLQAGSAPMTVRHLHALLHNALKQAAARGEIVRNVASLVKAPVATRKDMVTLTEEQTRAFLSQVEADRLEAMYVIAVTTGARQGELLGVRWKDVDLERATMQIQQSLQHIKGDEFTIVPPKTPRSRRQLALTSVAVAALRRHRKRQLEEQLAAAGGWHKGGLVFPSEVGLPMKADKVRWDYWALLRRAGLPRIRFHDLRHTAATLMLGRGVHPKIVSEMLGHSSVAFTMDTYQHVTPTMQREAANEFEKILAGGER